jgi:hypothetical protein
MPTSSLVYLHAYVQTTTLLTRMHADLLRCIHFYGRVCLDASLFWLGPHQRVHRQKVKVKNAVSKKRRTTNRRMGQNVDWQNVK